MTENTQPFIQDELQTQAITLGCGTNDRIVCVTGPAGTGKTTIMLQIYNAFVNAGHKVAIAAPTGKAAKRISEATGLPAVTLHRLLEYTHPGDPDPKTGKVTGVSVPRRGPENRLEYSVVLVDEYSMINNELDRTLLDAIPAGGLVRCFGDINQLPPIENTGFNGPPAGPSAFTRHLKNFPSVKLEKIYRQGEGSGIVTNAARILKGWVPQQADDFQMVIGKNPVETVMDMIMAEGAKFHTLDWQIITPTHMGWTGTRALNLNIQEMLQGEKMHEAHVMPRTRYDKVKSLVLIPGDKILWTKNDYHLEIYNGETGIVKKFEHDQVFIDFGDREVAIPPHVEYIASDGSTKNYDPRTTINLAYAVTTHASQGSEYSQIAYIMDKSSSILHDRSNFYTAITRARYKTTVVTDQRSLQRAVSTLKVRF